MSKLRIQIAAEKELGTMRDERNAKISQIRVLEYEVAILDNEIIQAEAAIQSMADAAKVDAKEHGTTLFPPKDMLPVIPTTATVTITTRKKESLRKAVIRIIKKEDRFIHIKEIMPILEREGYFIDVNADQVSRTLTGLKGGTNPYGLITRRAGVMANTFWGFYYFMDGDLVRPQHMDTEALLRKLDNTKKATSDEAA